ncbi:hypothetical protein ACFX16_007795 [Malus domestica]
MAWAVALVPWNLDGTAWAWARASFDGTTWAVVMVPWTSPRMVAVVATAVVTMVELCSGGATPLIVTFSLVDRRSPIS